MVRAIQTKPAPHCPDCGAQMALRKPGPSQDWEPFWGCSQYPECRGSRNIMSDGKPEEDEDYLRDAGDAYLRRNPIDSDDLPF